MNAQTTLSPLARIFSLIVLGAVVGAVTCATLQALKLGLGQRVETGWSTYKDFHDSETVVTVADAFSVGLLCGPIVGFGAAVMMFALEWSDRAGRITVGLVAGFVCGLLAARITLSMTTVFGDHVWPPRTESFEISRIIISKEWDPTILSLVGALLGLGVAISSVWLAGRLRQT